MEIFPFDESVTDVFVYIGEINRKGYADISKEIANIPLNERKEKTLLCLATFGGDPDAGYRIGRCLQHHYENQVTLYAPSLCKSSGTLTAIAANNLIIGNEGELGPLDIQLRKADEMGEQSSGLDIFKAVKFLEDRVMMEFSRYLTEIRFGSGVSTRLSADIAAKLVNSVIEPISSQIDPIKIGEHQRAIGIAQRYGELLNEMTSILKPQALTNLIADYPSHGFVIDRKEAGKLFNNVYKPCDKLRSYLEICLSYCFDFTRLGSTPIVLKFPLEIPQENLSNEQDSKSIEPEMPQENPENEPPTQNTPLKSTTESGDSHNVSEFTESSNSAGVKPSTKRSSSKRN